MIQEHMTAVVLHYRYMKLLLKNCKNCAIACWLNNLFVCSSSNKFSIPALVWSFFAILFTSFWFFICQLLGLFQVRF